MVDTRWPVYEKALATGDTQTAYKIAHNAARLYEERNDPVQTGVWLNALALCLYEQGRYEEASAVAEKSAEIQPDLYKRAGYWILAAGSYSFSNRYSLSFVAFNKAEEIARIYQKDTFLKGRVWGCGAVLFARIGDWDRAIVDSEKAVEALLKASVPGRAMRFLNNACYLLSCAGHPQKAEPRLLAAMELLNKEPNRFAEANIYDSLGFMYTMMGRYTDAERLLRHASAIFGKLSNKAEFAGSLLNLSRLHERMRLYKEAREDAAQAMKLATDASYDPLWLEARKQLSSLESILSRGSTKSRLLHGIIYVSSAMEDVIARLRNIALTDEVVLLLGETGTGKELAARALHLESRRSKAPFVPFNCSTLSRDLVESRLFGHCRGAFTGADRDHKGVIRAAEGGTLFLDEIGDLSLEAQGALLRFLQSGEIQPVGANRPVSVNARVIAATNRDLAVERIAGRFREDLYHRLSGITLWLPPLRLRRADIAPLARHFAAFYSEKYDKTEASLSDAEISRLDEREWPGNVRELENYIKRRILVGSEPIQNGGARFTVPARTWRSLSEEEKHQRLIEALERNGGNVTRTAEQLGLSRRAVQKIRSRMQQART
jgi:DNA-binding NtrC family response regulator